VFEYRVEGLESGRGGTLAYRWADVVRGFDMPVRVNIPGLGTQLVHPTEAWQTLSVTSPKSADLTVDENFYVTARQVP